ncbi:MAG: DUF2798 domain-containing protein [Gammaproteobacteria bacterium]|nr:DUF2798 domain-containing protein [Gammaproteobacteria bacterium]
MQKLPKQFTAILFAFYMSAIMAFLMCLAITLINTGYGGNFFTRAMQAYLVAMPMAFVCVLIVRPLVMQLVGWTVEKH